MPNRLIKESICTSEEIDALTGEQEAFFYRLTVQCDDFGLMDGRLKILASKCYPLRSIDIKKIQSHLDALVSIGLIKMYSVGDKPYITIINWAKHQQIRAKKAKYPLPSEGVDINCNQLQSDVHVIQSNPIQSSQPDGFVEFWSAYPKKVGKGAAESAWKKLKPPADKCMAALATQKNSVDWKKENGQYIPNPATWINQRRWEDGETAADPGELITLPDGRQITRAQQDFLKRVMA